MVPVIAYVWTAIAFHTCFVLIYAAITVILDDDLKGHHHER